MRIPLTAIACAILIVIFCPAIAQQSSYNPGIWQTFGAALPLAQYPDLKGRLVNFTWKELELSDNVWDWTVFDSDLTSRTADRLPLTFMVYTKQDAPDWLYTKGVPKVIEKDNNGLVTGYSPYYADSLYKSYFKRMIQKVHAHVETLPPSVRNYIVAVQGCYGSTGDYISYKGNVPSQYYLSGQDFYTLFQEFSQYYYDEYGNTNPKIYLLSNPQNQGGNQAQWVVATCPGWLKTGSIGKGYQLNDENDKYTWLYSMINQPQSNGDFIRARSEMIGGNLYAPWWIEIPYQNMFAVMCYDVFWGLDWNNQGSIQLSDPLNDSAFSFFNKYAGQKIAAQSTNAMCALKDGLDASDTDRFPTATYGAVSRSNQQRYMNIMQQFSVYGAKQEDPYTATLYELDNIFANGINDVGWNIFPGNYDRFLHQINPNTTSAGYWNVVSANPSSMYGRFARGFDVANGKNGLYFDVDSSFLGNVPLKGKYPVTISVTYLDKGTGSWRLYYDSKQRANVASISVICTNTNTWKKATVTLKNANFGNRGLNGSDFSIRSTNGENVIFSVVELSRTSGFAGFAAAAQTSILDSDFTDDEIVSGTHSITNTITTNKLVIAPNPAEGQFYIELKNKEQIQELLIYNLAGRQVVQKKVNSARIIMSKNEVGSAGVYYIRVLTNNGWVSGKLVVL